MDDPNLLKAVTLIGQKKYKMAISLLTPLAKKGGAEAQFQLGFLYFTSADVSRAESIEWLRKASDQNHPKALYRVSSFRKDFSTGSPDTKKGFRLLKKAAKLGCAEAQRDLGALYATGDEVVKRNLKWARHWYGLAAHAGHSDASYNFAFMLVLGEGGAKETSRGCSYFERAAKCGEREAARLLVDSYRFGQYGFPIDLKRSNYWKRRMAAMA